MKTYYFLYSPDKKTVYAFFICVFIPFSPTYSLQTQINRLFYCHLICVFELFSPIQSLNPQIKNSFYIIFIWIFLHLSHKYLLKTQITCFYLLFLSGFHFLTRKKTAKSQLIRLFLCILIWSCAIKSRHHQTTISTPFPNFLFFHLTKSCQATLCAPMRASFSLHNTSAHRSHP